MGKNCNIGALIDSRPISALQWRLIVVCALAMAVDGFDAQAIGYVAPALVKDLQLDRALLGPIFTAGVLGMGLGNLMLGLASDMLGRKTVLLASLVLFGVLTLAKSQAGSFEMLIALQFVAGLGIGGAYPAAIALISEYVPARVRSQLVTGGALGFLVGTTCGGWLTAAIMPVFGWRVVFQIGGGVALTLALIAALAVPPSLRQLAQRGNAKRRILGILRALAPDVALSEDVEFVYAANETAASPVASLFHNGRAAYTVLIWTTVFMILISTYFVFSWLPTLLAAAKLSVREAVLASSAFPVASGLGSILLAPHLRRPLAPIALSAACALFAAGLAAMGDATSGFPVLVATVFLAGLGNGAQGVTHALNSAVYPTSIRATGIGWATGIGRLGSTLGPLLGGVLVGWDWRTEAILKAAAVPALFASVATALMYILPAASAALREGFRAANVAVTVREVSSAVRANTNSLGA